MHLLLLENAVQSVLQELRLRIVCRNHDGPKRAALVDQQYADCRRSETTGGMPPF